MKINNKYIEEYRLAEAIAAGDELAFRQTFELYKGIVYGTAYKWCKSSIAAEEITQEVFIKLWSSRHLLKDVNNLQAYIYKMTFNKTRNFIRSANIEKRHIDQLQFNTASYNNVEDFIAVRESQSIIATALSRLSRQKQTIYTLSKIDGKSYKEIADCLNISIETVRSHLYETMKYLRLYQKNIFPTIILFFIAFYLK